MAGHLIVQRFTRKLLSGKQQKRSPKERTKVKFKLKTRRLMSIPCIVFPYTRVLIAMSVFTSIVMYLRFTLPYYAKVHVFIETVYKHLIRLHLFKLANV